MRSRRSRARSRSRWVRTESACARARATATWRTGAEITEEQIKAGREKAMANVQGHWSPISCNILIPTIELLSHLGLVFLSPTMVYVYFLGHQSWLNRSHVMAWSVSTFVLGRTGNDLKWVKQQLKRRTLVKRLIKVVTFFVGPEITAKKVISRRVNASNKRRVDSKKGWSTFSTWECIV